MPSTVNGIGTHYYGKKNLQVRSDVCRSCGRAANLSSFDTRLWFVVFFLPVIPLGRKRIMDQCSICRRHWAADQDKWEMARQLSVSGAMEKYRSAPSPESALELHGILLGFHMLDEAQKFRDDAQTQHSNSPNLFAGLASQLDAVGRAQDATPYYHRAYALRPELPMARAGVARRRMVNGELDEARKLLDFLEQPGAGQSQDSSPLEELAHCYQKAGRHAEVIEICRHLLAEAPPLGRIHAFRKFVTVSEKALTAQESILPQRSFSLAGLFN